MCRAPGEGVEGLGIVCGDPQDQLERGWQAPPAEPALGSTAANLGWVSKVPSCSAASHPCSKHSDVGLRSKAAPPESLPRLTSPPMQTPFCASALYSPLPPWLWLVCPSPLTCRAGPGLRGWDWTLLMWTRSRRVREAMDAGHRGQLPRAQSRVLKSGGNLGGQLEAQHLPTASKWQRRPNLHLDPSVLHCSVLGSPGEGGTWHFVGPQVSFVIVLNE